MEIDGLPVGDPSDDDTDEPPDDEEKGNGAIGLFRSFDGQGKAMTGRFNRLALDENNPSQASKDVNTGKSPVFYLGRSLCPASRAHRRWNGDERCRLGVRTTASHQPMQ